MGFAGDYGSDWAAGVAKAAEANGLEVAWTYTPPATEFDVAQAVGLMVTQPVDAYFPAICWLHNGSSCWWCSSTRDYTIS